MRLLPTAAVLLSLACAGKSTPPATRSTVHLRGNAYARGFSHGEQLKSRIQSFYTRLMTASLYPYLGREQPDIATLLKEYDGERYQNGNFAYALLLDSARNLEKSLTVSQKEELRGISEGSGMAYEQILILNTFVDTVLAVRGVALSIRLARAPQLKSLEVPQAASDGADNDGDGMIDEPGEGVLSAYVAEAAANLVELPTNATFRVVLEDADGVDPATLRFTLDGALFTPGAQVSSRALSATQLEVTFTPPQGLPPSAVVSLVLSAGDTVVVTRPPPSHQSFMRDEELLFTTRGRGLAPPDVRRPPITDGRTRAPSLALALRGAATRDGKPLLAQHFALLDANVAHEHTVQFVHHPEGAPPFVTFGWAGVAWGFAGLSARGVAYACNPADTLDNSVVGSVVEQLVDLGKARLLAKGVPIGFVGRRILEGTASTQAAVELVQTLKHPYGWSCVVADKAGDLRALELDSNVFTDAATGVFSYGPTDLDASGRRYGSVRDDDLLSTSVFARNRDDIAPLMLAGQRIVPQRVWSTFFFRGRRAVDGLARRVEAQYGQLDAAAVQGILAESELVDGSDSMNAVVLEPARLQAWSAMGQVPATEGPFEAFDLAAEAAP